MENKLLTPPSSQDHLESLKEFPPVVNDAELEVTAGLVCLLCSRQFGSAETLKKHQQISELHKTNLEIARRQQQQRLKDEAQRKAEEAYEKAKQREAKRKVKSTTMPTPEPQALDENNVGSKLLQKMGWKQGEGIGKSAVLQAPIEVSIRSDRAGLGLNENGEHSVVSGDTYQTAVKKRARARWGLM